MFKFPRLLAKISRWLLPALPIIGVLVLTAMFAEPALAADMSDWSAWTGPLAMIVSGIIMIIVLFAFIFAIFLGNLMDSTYIFDSGMGDTLHLIWEVMRNFVNIGFILILLVIAVMVIFGGGGERGLGLLKKVLPKFVLALILVNFTFFAARFVLTANDVLATAIFSLPRTVSAEQMIRMPCDPTDSRSCLDQIKDTMEKAANENGAASAKITAITEAVTAKDRWFSQTVEKLSLGKKNMSLVLLSSMIDLEHIVYIKGQAGDGIDLAITAIGSLIVAGAVGIIFFMLFLAFVVRMVVLWVAIAVSPLAALGIVLKELIPGLDMGKGGFDPVKVFVSHAFMPTMVAIPLSIGMIMIFANNAVDYDMSTGWIKTFSDQSGEIHALLWWVASIVVIWFGTNKMIKEASPEFAAKLTDGIHGGVNKFVGSTAGLLKYAPVIPAMGSVANLQAMPGIADQRLRDATEEKRRNLGTGMARVVGAPMGIDVKGTPNYEALKGDVKVLARSAEKDASKQKDAQERFSKAAYDHAQNGGDGSQVLGDAMLRDLKKIYGDGSITQAKINGAHTFAEAIKKLEPYVKSETEREELRNTYQKFLDNGATAKSQKGDAGAFEDEGKRVSKDDKGNLVDDNGKTYDRATEVKGTGAKENVFILEKKEADDSISKYYATKTGDDNYSIIINTKDKKQLKNNIDMRLIKVEKAKEDGETAKVEEATRKLMRDVEK